jgi:pyruvate dehydrogenase E1 component
VRVQLLGSGTILREVLAAAEVLSQDYGVASDVWSVTSFSELRREGMACDRWNMRHPAESPRDSYVSRSFISREGPFIAATDYMQIVPDQIRPWVPGRYVVLGTDGYGRSDRRSALRDFFEVDHRHIVLAALKALCDEGAVDVETVAGAIEKMGIDPDKPDPVTL